MYWRDFTLLNDLEQKALENYHNKINNTGVNGLKFHGTETWKILDENPALWYYLSLFPNNAIFPTDLTSDFYPKNPIVVTQNFQSLINIKSITERDVLNFIKDNYAYYIPVSIAKSHTNWGHHELYLFPEFQLGSTFKVDYLIVGKNSDGYHFMFVEFESVFGQITLKNGEFGKAIKKGESQIKSWKYWLERNFSFLESTFIKFLSKGSTLPDEFYKLDSSRLFFAIVCGRREHFNELTRRERRELKINHKIILFHYDNLVDSTIELINDKSFG